MDKKNAKSSSSCKKRKIDSVANSEFNKEFDEQLKERVNKFLKKGFHLSAPKIGPLTEDEMCDAAKSLGKYKNLFKKCTSFKEYIEFLNQYGAMFNNGFGICGPSQVASNKKKAIKDMMSSQGGFNSCCGVNGVKKRELASYWQIAYVDQEDEYLIDVSKNGKGFIYSMSYEGKSRLFAKSFLEFLENFFEEYDRLIVNRKKEKGEEDSE